MNYQKFILVGNASNDAQTRKSKKGDVTFTTFSVAVGNTKNQANFFPVVVFGDQGMALANLIKKGRQMLVEGHIEVNEGRFTVVGDYVALGFAPQQPKSVEKAEETK